MSGCPLCHADGDRPCMSVLSEPMDSPHPQRGTATTPLDLSCCFCGAPPGSLCKSRGPSRDIWPDGEFHKQRRTAWNWVQADLHSLI